MNSAAPCPPMEAADSVDVVHGPEAFLSCTGVRRNQTEHLIPLFPVSLPVTLRAATGRALQAEVISGSCGITATRRAAATPFIICFALNNNSIPSWLPIPLTILNLHANWIPE